MGLEPTTFGITIRRSNQLSYIYHVGIGGAKIAGEAGNGKKSSAERISKLRKTVMLSFAGASATAVAIQLNGISCVQ